MSYYCILEFKITKVKLCCLISAKGFVDEIRESRILLSKKTQHSENSYLLNIKKV